jgi:predicted neutral ceramidase superfamily lipid hydrolase
MTEAESLEVIALYNVNVASYLAIFISVTFAYLTVAYFQGRALTDFQVRVASGLYVLWSGLLALGVYENTVAWELMAREHETILSSMSVYGSGVLHIPLAIVLVVSILVSLYFMHDVRRE